MEVDRNELEHRWAPPGDGHVIAISTEIVSAASRPAAFDGRRHTLKTVDARTGIEWLERDEFLRLLANDEVRRLAVNDWHTPVIFPVNYHLDGEVVVFRTDPGTKLSRGPWAPASFEIDAFDREHRSGWSVVVVGRLEKVTPYDAATLDRVKALPVDPWAGGQKEHWMRPMPTRITGRRVGGDHR